MRHRTELLAAAVTFALGFGAFFFSDQPSPPWADAMTVLAGLIAASSLLFIVRFPLAVTLVTVVMAAFGLIAAPAVWYAMFNLSRRRPVWMCAWVCALFAVAVGVELVWTFAYYTEFWTVELDHRALRVAILVAGFLVGATTCAALAGFMLERHDRRLIEASEEVFLALERERSAAESTIVDERERMRRTIHDDIGHRLAILNLFTESLRNAQHLSPEQTRQVSDTIRVQVEQASAALTRTLERTDSTFPPDEAIDAILGNLSRAGFPVVVRSDPRIRLLPDDRARLLISFCQEGITNALKYAARGSLTLTMRPIGHDGVEAELRSPLATERSSSSPPSTKRGLRALGDDARRLGGSVEFTTQSGQGRLRLSLPPSSDAPPDVTGS